jgi:hypothetical protein
MERRLKIQDALRKQEEPAVEVSDFWLANHRAGKCAVARLL